MVLHSGARSDLHGKSFGLANEYEYEHRYEYRYKY